MRGRKRKVGKREKNGRLERPTLAQLESADRANRLSETAVVLAQPHRQGDDDVRLVSALGRFAKRCKLRREIMEAATEYANKEAWWGRAVGRPRGFENATPRPGNGNGPSDATVRGWLDFKLGVDTMLMRHSLSGYKAFRRLVIDDCDPEPSAATDAALATALRLVAIHTGHITARVSAFD